MIFSDRGGVTAEGLRGQHAEPNRIDINRIQPNPDQPRRDIDETDDSFVELCNSIWAHDLIQPVVVWEPPTGPEYMLIAGERRWRAFRLLALRDPTRFSAIPAVMWTNMRHGAAATAVITGLLENVVREDLRFGDRAAAVARLRALTGWTFKAISMQMGLSLARVQELAVVGENEPVVDALNAGRITNGGAIAIARTAKRDDQLAIELLGVVDDIEPRLLAPLVDEVAASSTDLTPAARVRAGVTRVVGDDSDVDLVRLRTTPLAVTKPRMTVMPRGDYVIMLRRALREAKQ